MRAASIVQVKAAEIIRQIIFCNRTDQFGHGVSISGDTLVVGADRDDDRVTDSGSVYVFVGSGSNWTQQAKLTASDGAYNDTLGHDVSISGDTIVASAIRDDDQGTDSGSVYVFQRTGTIWTQQAKLLADDGLDDEGYPIKFGINVSLDGDTLLIGAFGGDGIANDTGSAYVLVRDGSNWTQQAKLIANDGNTGDYFGWGVALDGDIAVVGALFNDELGTDAGAAYVFERSGSSWTFHSKLTAPDGMAGVQLGRKVAVSNNTILVGAEGDNTNGSLSGAAYFFEKPTTSLLQTTIITYEYDDLYRLTDATYTGAVEAHYQYTYDAVGNMEMATETVAAETTSVSRSFDAANQLQTATDKATGTTSYYYDGNGNMIYIIAPGASSPTTVYGYNQRNLLTRVENSISSSAPLFTSAEYNYDGSGDRVQQTDYTDSIPVITTYANDPMGMTQMLLANDGTTQTAQLYGLDLIGHDDGTGMRLLLADGLGSVRQEMSNGAVDVTTTYAPYGKVLAQTGTSGTVYGYTGEQEDAVTGLVYLRARYYNPYLNQWMSRDPFPGYSNLPQTQNGYSYVNGNPINYSDPTGADPHWCASQTYPGVPSHAIQDAIQNCYAEYYQTQTDIWRQQTYQNLPPLFGSSGPYLVYDGYAHSQPDCQLNGYCGTLTLHNGPGGTQSWDARSGAYPGASDFGALKENSNYGVPYISGDGFFSEPDGQQYPPGMVCYQSGCYSFPSGTFPVDFPSFQEDDYNNNARPNLPSIPFIDRPLPGDQWPEFWGDYRITLDTQTSQNIYSGLFIHAGPFNPTLGCIRLSNNDIQDLVHTLEKLNQPLRLFVQTPQLPYRPVGPETWWYSTFTSRRFVIEDGNHSPPQQ